MNIYKVKINFQEKDHPTIVLPIAEGESVLDVCIENGIDLQHNCGGVATLHLSGRNSNTRECQDEWYHDGG